MTCSSSELVPVPVPVPEQVPPLLYRGGWEPVPGNQLEPLGNQLGTREPVDEESDRYGRWLAGEAA